MPLNSKNKNVWKQVGKTIVLDEAYLKTGLDRKNKWGAFKKITGTRLSAVLGLSKYNSPFKTWMTMVNLFKDEMDPTLSIVGNTIEPILKKYAETKLDAKFLTHNPSTINYDAFPENRVFGGIPDGEPLVNGRINYSTGLPMLEIKTSSIDKFSYVTENGSLKMNKDKNGLPIVKEIGGKRAEWFNGGTLKISPEYQFQLSLYMYLRNITKGMFVVGFLEKEDYVKPEEFDPKKREIKFASLNFDSINDFKNVVTLAEEWYDKHIVTGISPEMTADDEAWLKKEILLAK
ncbi:MAG: YqaJ viral recombinase family protein [Mycoplasmoidaceae bacterium]|nr:MAG: YqaJ viral recombinase family protein [Mycoplasmoidaceae bacterium]